MSLTASQAVSLVLVTLVWGMNWAVMKAGVSEMTPLVFRAACLWGAVPVLALFMHWRGIPFKVPRGERNKILQLGFLNIVCWNTLIILSLPLLSSGRAAILGYTMPVFAAIAGALIYKTPMQGKHFIGILAALSGSVLLLWHEMATLAGQPAGVLLALSAALCWGIGTQLLRHARMTAHIVTFTFWSILLGASAILILALLFELQSFQWPARVSLLAVAYNSLLVLSLAQVAWFSLARGLPPQASTLGVMMIPVIGVFSGVILLNEAMHWQDLAAVALMLLAMFSVLWPSRSKKDGASASQ